MSGTKIQACRNQDIPYLSRSGEVAEWSIASVLKTEEAKASVGSNPTLSATFGKQSKIGRL